MKDNLNDLEKKRTILNDLVKNIAHLDEKDKSLLQEISEEMDMLILDYIKNNEQTF